MGVWCRTAPIRTPPPPFRLPTSKEPTMADNAECEGCGVTAADLPYEHLGMTLAEASEFLFVHEDGKALCNGCAE
jgi:hypothetical protein